MKLLYLFGLILLPLALAQVNDRICPVKTKAINDVKGLPRFDSKGRLGVSGNWADYPLFNCTTDPHTQKENCDFVTPNPKEGPWRDYVTSLAFYPAFAFLMFIILFFFSICLCFCRYCCCCIRGGGCGKRYPTPKGKDCCWCLPPILGYIPMTVNNQQTFGYPDPYRWGNRVYMWIFVFFLFLWIGMGHFQGNEALTDSMVSVATSPSVLLNHLLDTLPVFFTFAENLIGKDFVNFITNLNGTINNATSISGAIDNLTCVIDAIQGLPDVSDIKEFVDRQLNETRNTTDIVNAMNAALAQLESDKASINASINNLTAYTQSVSANINATLDNMTNSLNKSNELDFIQNKLLNKTTGIQSILDDIDKMDSNKPPQAEIDSAVTGTDSIQTIRATPKDDPPLAVASRNTIISKITALRDRYNAFPDFNNTADRMEQYNANLKTMKDQNMTGKLRQQVHDSQNALDNLFGDDVTTHVNNSIHEILDKVHNISWSGLYGVIDLVNETLKNATSPERFEEIFQPITDLTSIIPCINDMIGAIGDVNRTLIRFPNSVQDQMDQITNLNGTLNDVLDQVKNLTQTIKDYLNTSSTVNLTGMKSDIDKMKNDTDSNAQKVDANGIVERLQNATNSSNITTFNKMLTDLDALDNAIANSSIDPLVIAQFRNLSVGIKKIQTDLTRAVVDLTFWSSYGACLDGSNCTLITDCASCTATGFKRCRFQGNTHCNTDSECNGTMAADYCLTDDFRLPQLQVELEASLAQFTDNNSTKNNLQTMNNSLITDLQSGYVKEINRSAESLKNVSANAFIDETKDLSSALDGFNVSQSKSTFDNLLQQLQNLNFSSIERQLDDFNSTSKSLEDGRKYLNQTKELLTTMKGLLYDKLPGPNGALANISSTKLASIRHSKGYAAVLLQITTTIDGLIQFINDGQSMLPNITVNLTEQSDTPREVLEILNNDSYTKQGPYHLVFAIKDRLENTSTIIFPGQKDNQIFKDTDGKDYPDNKKCLTNKCVANSIDHWNNAAASDLMTELLGANATKGYPNVPVSRTQIVDGPYLIPFFIAIFAAASSLLLFPGYWSDFWSSCLASFTCCLVLCQMPFIFLFAGFFFFVPLIGGDACLSVENVGYVVLTKQGQSICESFGGNGTSSNCTFAFGNASDPSSSAPNFSFALNFPKIYKDVLGTCDPQQDALNPVYDAARGLAKNYLPNEMDDKVAEFNDPEANDGLYIQPPLINVVHLLGLDVSNSTGSFVNDFQGQVGCDDLHDVYAAAKNAFCCDVMTSIYWMVASWYLIGWSMLCCGCGASLLGRKRFPYALWGAAMEEDMNKLNQENSEVQEVDLVAQEGGPNSNGLELEESRLPAPSRGMSMGTPTPGARSDQSGVEHESIAMDDLKGRGHEFEQAPHLEQVGEEDENQQEWQIEPVSHHGSDPGAGDGAGGRQRDDGKDHLEDTFDVQ